MQILKKSLLIPTCLTLLSASSQAALVLEFNEVGSNQVELSFSGTVDLTGSFNLDDSNPTNFTPTIHRGGLGLTTSTNGAASFAPFDLYTGSDLLPTTFANITVQGAPLGLLISDATLYVGSGLTNTVLDDNLANISILSANSGGLLFNVNRTFNTTFTALGLDTLHAQDTLIDLWRVTGTTGTDNLIQFRVNSTSATSVPEPSSLLMSGLGLLAMTARRKRKA